MSSSNQDEKKRKFIDDVILIYNLEIMKLALADPVYSTNEEDMPRLLALLVKAHRVKEETIVKIITDSKLNTASFIHFLISQHNFKFETRTVLEILLKNCDEGDVVEKVGDMIEEDLFDLSNSCFIDFVKKHRLKAEIISAVICNVDTFRGCGKFINEVKLLSEVETAIDAAKKICEVLSITTAENLNGSVQEMIQELSLSTTLKQELLSQLTIRWSLDIKGQVQNTYENPASSSTSDSAGEDNDSESYEEVESSESDCNSAESSSSSEEEQQKKLNKRKPSKRVYKVAPLLKHNSKK
jgi:hypothetical protein